MRATQIRTREVLSLSLWLALAHCALAQFTQIPISIPGLRYPSVAWGDFNNDGYPDLLVSGDTGSGLITRIYRNDGGTNFVDIQAGLPGISGGQVAWADYNGDGYLDFAMTGMTSTGRVSRIYRNNHDGTFTDIGANLPGLDSSRIAWADYDNDGDLDLFLIGYDGVNYFSRIFRNDGNDVFTDTGIKTIIAGAAGSAAWADFDNDGDMDLMFAGFTSDTSSGQSSRLYRNTGGAFTNITSISLTAMSQCSVAWGDYDNDGYLDLLMAGSSIAGVQSFPTLKLYHNNGTGGGFTSISSGMSGAQNCSVAWGDFDNDGYLDVAIAGYNTSFAPFATIYRNLGNGTFADSGASIGGLIDCSLAWGDFDNDGDLDLLISGFDGTTNVTRLYRNDASTANTIPSAPFGLGSFVSGKTASLSWGPGSDGNQSGGFTYNLRMGTSSGASDIMPSMADPTTGFRRASALGNVNEGLSWTLKLPVGTYYWSAQTIDHAFAGSPFADEQSFSIPPQAPDVTTLSATNVHVDSALLQANVNPNGDDTMVYFEYGTDTNYGSTTVAQDIGSGASSIAITALLTSLLPAQTYQFRAVAMNSYGTTYGTNQSFITTLFTEVTSINLLGVGASSVAWGDYDNDGYLDLLIAGGTSSNLVTRIYHNLGGTNFVDIQAGLPGINSGQVAWGDYDNDGRLDVLITGNGSISHVYHNDGNNVFTDIGAGLPGLSTGASCAWGDFNNDGTLDFAMTGAGGLPIKTYRNDGGGQFTDFTNTLPKLSQSSIAWADYDNNGTLDLLLSGYNYGVGGLGDMTRLYRNDGHGVFTNSNLSFQGVSSGSVAWGDYNGDGFLDFLLTGSSGGNRYSIIYSNNGAGGFVSRTLTTVAKMDQSSVAWGDFNNDGKLDFIAAGTTSTGAVVKVYRNDGGTVFHDAGANLPGLSGGSVAWGDFDNDGRLDLIITGYTGSNYVAKIYRNNSLASNTPPTAPAGLNSSVLNNAVTLNWGAASDPDQTGGLSYNLRVGTAPGAGDIVGPMAGASGFRRVPRLGNANLRLSSSLTNLLIGTYYWSVQAVDNCYAGSPFSTNGSFTITAALLPPVAVTKPATNVSLTIGATLQGSANPKGAPTTVFFQYGTTTNFGSTTTPVAIGSAITNVPWSNAISGLGDGITYYFRLVASNANATVVGATLSFTSATLFSNVVTSLPVLGVGNSGWAGCSAWGDYDNDGDLDVALSGVNLPATYLYRNDGGGVFTLVNSNLPSANYGTIEWGDFDHDGYVDLLIAGPAGVTVAHNNGDGSFTVITNLPGDGTPAAFATWVDYNNDGNLDISSYDYVGNYTSAQARLFRNVNGTFVPSGIAMPPLTAGWMAWGDYDGDGYPDLAVTGQIIITNTIHDSTRIFHNDGQGNLTDINAPLTGLENGRVAWSDVDNDGKLDLVVNGGSPSPALTLVYHNDNGNFTNVAANLPGATGPMALADYDNDGYPDIMLQFVGPSTTTNRIYRNNGNGTFADSGKVFFGQVSSMAWADYNKDGALDVLLGSQLYRNTPLISNAPPSAPAGLVSTRTNKLMTLQWNSASDPNQSGGLTYNLQMGNSPGAFNVISPDADANGWRRVTKPGIASRPIWKLTLPVGTYYWKVQAIDASLAGSPFSAEANFTIPAQPPDALTLPPTTNAAGYPTVNGTANPNGLPTTAWFEYGLTNFEFRTPPQALSNGIYTLSIAADPAGLLLPETNYTFRLVASNSLGKSLGGTLTFRVPFFNDRTVTLPPNIVSVILGWGDYDNDGKLDLLVSDYYAVKLYHNDNGLYTNLVATFAALSQGAAAWGDYNNDGNLDFALTGRDMNYNRFTKLYRNDGTNHFTEITLPMAGVYDSAVAWADFDNDGDLDLLVTGVDQSGHTVIQLCRNLGNDVFTLIPTSLPAVASRPVISCADYDNDGLVDVLIAGVDTNGVRICRLFHNNGNFSFSDSGQVFPGFDSGSASWGDFDNDGRLDLLLTGWDTTNYYAKVFHNTGSGFQEMPLGLPGVLGAGAWLDYDCDGALDIVLQGNTNVNDPNGAFFRLYRNTGGGTFVDSGIRPPLVSQSASRIWAADYDGDGDPDMIADDYLLLRNESPRADLPPSAPAGLSSTVVNNSASLTWAPASDPNQSGGLSYNVRVGTSPGGGDTVSGMALPGNGKRLVPELGNAFGRLNFKLAGLRVGTYYWSVQAIDHSRLASGFSTNGSFVIPPQAPTVLSATTSNLTLEAVSLVAQANPNGAGTLAWFDYGLTANYTVHTTGQNLGSGTAPTTFTSALTGLIHATLYHFRAVASNSFGVVFGADQTFSTPQFTEVDIGLPSWPGTIAVGDYNNDKALDILMSTYSSSPTLLYRNNGSATFTNTGLQFTGLNFASIDWGDYNNDGNLDFVLSGFNSSAYNVAIVFRNNGDGTFTQIPLTNAMSSGSVRWGDYDNDGKLDILLSGGGWWQVFHNNGNDTFTPVASSSAVGGFAVWGDYDGDGYLDFVVTGVDTNGNGATRLIHNDGHGGFADSGIVLPNLFGRAAWGDFDNDGHLDLLLSGAFNSYVTAAGEVHLFHNNGHGGFTEVPTALPNRNCTILLADFNNDGRLDVILSAPQYGGSYAAVYRNDGNFVFTQIPAGWPQVGSEGGLACGDLDADGDLDFLLAGYTGSNYLARLYVNNSPISNSPPNAPTGLTANPVGNGVTLSWSAATDSNQIGGHSYNVRIGTAPGKADILNPMADLATGRRKVAQLGNAQENLFLTITNLAAGTYYWSVQAIDNSLAGSAFAPESSFVRATQPLANPQFVMLAEDTPTPISLTGSDPDGRALSFTVLTQPTHGVLSGSPPNLIYLPATNYFGADSFSFFDNNGLTNSAPAQVTIAVTQVPDVAGASLSIGRTNNQFRISLVGEPYDHYRIEASQDLIHWVAVTNLLPTNGPLPFIDPDASLYPRRFYRAALQLTQPQLSSPRLLAGGPFQFSFAADVGRYYQVLASTNLRDWVLLTNLPAPTSNVMFFDPAATNYSRRFYRAQPQP